MTTIEEAETLISRMTRGEKALLLERVARDLADAFPGIDVIDGVCSTEVDLLRAYPGLRAEDLANVWAYVRAHRDEVYEQIRANEAA
jgi:hypothetical protein